MLSRLDQIFDSVDEAPRGKKCKGVLIKSAAMAICRRRPETRQIFFRRKVVWALIFSYTQDLPVINALCRFLNLNLFSRTSTRE